MYVRNGLVITEREKEIQDWSKFMDFLVPDIIPIRTTVESELRKRFKEEPASGDVVWGMFNYIVPRLHKYSDLSILYDNMALFLNKEGRKIEALEMLRMKCKMDIEDLREHDFYTAVIIRNKDDDFVCETCKKENGKRLSLDEALEKLPLPIHACTGSYCRCWLDAVTTYEDNPLPKNFTIRIEREPEKKRGLLGTLLKFLK